MKRFPVVALSMIEAETELKFIRERGSKNHDFPEETISENYRSQKFTILPVDKAVLQVDRILGFIKQQIILVRSSCLLWRRSFRANSKFDG